MSQRVEIGDTGLSSAEIDAIKGFLILCIILGHNTDFTKWLPGSFSFLYAFHVQGFLILSFLFHGRRLTARFVRDRAIRYLIPYFWIYLASAILFGAIITPNAGWVAWLWHVVCGLVLGTADAIKQGAGFRRYWFLPALFSLSLLRGFYSSVNRRWRSAILGCAVVVNIMAPILFPPSHDVFLFFGIAIAFYIFPLGMTAQWLWQRREHIGQRFFGAAALSIWAGASIVAHRYGYAPDMSSLVVEPITKPLLWSVGALIPIVAFISIAACSSVLARVPLMCIMGRNSLAIYLFHGFVFQAYQKALNAVGNWDANITCEKGSGGAVVAIGFVIVCAISLTAAIWVSQRTRLRSWLLPRSFSDWLPLPWSTLCSPSKD